MPLQAAFTRWISVFFCETGSIFLQISCHGETLEGLVGQLGWAWRSSETRRCTAADRRS